jgi:tetratricopeptide (TPR) repeat protein
LAAFVRQSDAAAAIAREALDLAVRFDLPELRASALLTMANISFTSSEFDEATRLEEEALAVAPPGSPQIIRALANRSLTPLVEADGSETRAWVARAYAAAIRAGDAPQVAWLHAAMIAEEYYKVGRWDEGLARIEEWLADAARLGGTYMAPALHLYRATILASRGDAEGAAADLEEGVAPIDSNADIQFQGAVVVGAAPICVLLGDTARAAALVERLAASHRAFARFAPPFTADFAASVLRCGRSGMFLERFADAKPHARLAAARLLWSARAAEAAEIYARAAPEEEAVARLVAAEQLAAGRRSAEAAVQLERGLAFFRAVGATHVVREGEQVLAAAS